MCGATMATNIAASKKLRFKEVLRVSNEERLNAIPPADTVVTLRPRRFAADIARSIENARRSTPRSYPPCLGATARQIKGCAISGRPIQSGAGR